MRDRLYPHKDIYLPATNKTFPQTHRTLIIAKPIHHIIKPLVSKQLTVPHLPRTEK
ncbi:MAG: hypothetical protein HYU39_04775 [Thaumarchaeota archaeon]|nr:hypothetical protein [Nitrososphaerota archaeon]